MLDPGFSFEPYLYHSFSALQLTYFGHSSIFMKIKITFPVHHDQKKTLAKIQCPFKFNIMKVVKKRQTLSIFLYAFIEVTTLRYLL